MPLLACAEATGQAACVGSVGVHGTLSDPVDLGGGLAGQRAVEATQLAVSEVLRYTDCASGQTLIVEVSQIANDPIVEAYDDRASAKAFQDKIAALSRPVSLQQLGALASQTGLRTSTRNIEFETCACRLFYPELRGGKERFDLNTVQ